MIAYYTKPKSEAKKGKFIYIELDTQQAEQLNKGVFREPDGHRFANCSRLHDHGSQFHLTTDGAFELYCEKRKETPRKVYILDTQKQLTSILEPLGILL
jgi:hypothetical protein